MTSEFNKMERIDTTCPVCRASGVWRLVRIEDAPAHVGVLWNDRASAMACPKGTIDFCCCRACGFVMNASFEPPRVAYEEGYDNALDFSPVFQGYARGLAEDLVSRYDLQKKDVVEIGCGRGDFLSLVCEVGGNRGVGFDPSAPAGDASPPTDGAVRIVQDEYSRRYRDVSADLIVCRQVFEHIADPREFLENLRETIGDRGTPAFFEVPNVRNIVEALSVWDIIYEHCSYFGAESLADVFSRSGFRVDAIDHLYEDQFLGIHVRPSGRSGEVGRAEAGDELIDHLRSFTVAYAERIRRWRDRLDSMKASDATAVVWGAGARGTTFVNLLDAGDRIRYLVDINPRKHGRFVPGTGQEIVPPERLSKLSPDLIVVMNPVYLDEIRASARSLGVSAEILAA